MTNLHAAIPEEKLTEAYRLLLEMRDNCVKHEDDQYDDPKREAKREALNIAITAMGRSVPTRWISVEERLPEKLKRVLVFKQRNGHALWCVAMWNIEIDWRGESDWSKNPDNGWFTVTHWMPLPESPEA